MNYASSRNIPNQLKVFLVFLLLAHQNMPFISGPRVSDVFQVILLVFVFLVAAHYSLTGIENKFGVFFLVFAGLHFVHGLTGGGFNLVLTFGFLMRLAIAYFIIRIVDTDFPKIYVKLLYFFAIMSLAFYIPLLISSYFADILFSTYFNFIRDIEFGETLNYHVFIYVFDNYIYNEIPRNAGIFWEPGAFGVFLNIAILFNIVLKKKMFIKQNIVFMLLILTTQSTGAYLSLFTIIISYYLVREIVKFKFVYLAIFVTIALTAYTTLPFMQEKIYGELEYYEDNPTAKHGQERITRFQSTAQDLSFFISNPITGRGSFNRHFVERDVNTTTSLLKHFGLIGFFFVFSYMYKSMKNFCVFNNFSEKFALFMIISIIVITFSQSMFRKPIFFAFCFMYLMNFKDYVKNSRTTIH